MKLEGAKAIGYRSLFIAGVRDPIFINQVEEIIEGNFRIKKLDLNFRTIDLAVITVSQVFIFLFSVFVKSEVKVQYSSGLNN